MTWPEKKRSGKAFSTPIPESGKLARPACACSFKMSLLFQQQISGGFLEKHQILPNSVI